MREFSAGKTAGKRGKEEKENRRGSTTNLRKEQLVPLHDALENLMRFVRERQCGRAPYFYRYLDYMKNNIEIFLYIRGNPEEDFRYLDKILCRDWNAANDMYIGIPSCKWFEKGPREPAMKYLELLEEVNQYFVQEQDREEGTGF